jgi:hypothetical protein
MNKKLKKFFDSLTKEQFLKQIEFAEYFDQYLKKRLNPFCEEICLCMGEQGINPYEHFKLFLRIVKENFTCSLK